MFNKKPRRNFRQRKNSSSDEDEQERKSGGAPEENQSVSVVVNKPTKASLSRGISCSSKREATPPRPGSSDEEDGGALERTEESITDKEGTKIKTNAILSFSDDKEGGESTFQLKKSSDKAVLFQVRKKKETSLTTTTHNKVSVVESDPSSSPSIENDSQPTSPEILSQDDDENSACEDKYSHDGGVGSPSDFSRTATKPAIKIPKREEIEAAKRRRHAARVQKDFIPISKDGQSSAGSSPDHCSRDGADDKDEDEDDDDNEPDDHQKRIEFAPRWKSIRERIAEKLGSDGSLSETEEEEQELWEETQIGKGVKRRPGEQSPSGSESSSCSSIGRRAKERHKKKMAALSKTLPVVTISMVKRRITKKLDSLTEVYRARQAELRRMEGDVENARSSAELLEESSSQKALQFYRSMTLYVHNLVECLREKIVEINSLELEVHSLLCDQMEALMDQRRAKVQEQAERLQQLSYNSDKQEGSSSNGADRQCEAKTSFITDEDCGIPEDTKLSAEDEDELQKKLSDILLRSREVFSDVQEEFCDVKKILSHFEEWRTLYSDSYHTAYISLILPKLLHPIIRHQLLMWNPLKEDSEDFENLPWFTGIETFCHGHGHEELEHTDRQTLSNVVERTVVPKMTAIVELQWDPLSHQQSVCLSNVCHKLKEDYSIFEGEQSKPVKAFMETVIQRLRSCVDDDIFIPLYPKKLLEDRLSPQRRFRDQQFWTAVKLLENMGLFEFLLPEPVLKELMLDKLLNRYLMITLSSQTLSWGAVDPCTKIADSLPLSWFKGESSCLPQLQNFRSHIVHKVHTICKEQQPKDPNTRSAVTEALKVLGRIRCHESIMTLAQKYRYEDVIYSHQLLNQDAT
ncbi:intron Large complex component GCFC2 isoform X2 [Gouania willdenowi]|uniref:intron Large complex component GCFC2 isoform X2 n=1 Tax=Gouania willdenowi TaxID=441366 RepID=UPI001056DED7|nr:GC-rich sequence DNA-binding factor 2-like isoform X2 [Gouania willdenowi]